jgi:hypothetical protein
MNFSTRKCWKRRGIPAWRDEVARWIDISYFSRCQ